MAIDDVADRAESYGFDGVAINGNDVLAVYQATQGALARARSGEGPTLIECKTYRWHGHSEHDKAFYRTDEELAMWKSRDPIPTFTTYLQGAATCSTDEKLKEIEARVTATIDDAVEFAMNAPDPEAGGRGRRTCMPKELTYLEAIREALARRDAARSEGLRPRRGRRAVRRRVRRHAGPLRGVRRDARPRHADLRVGHRRRQHRRVAARVPAGGRDAVRRLHLVRLRSDRQPGGDAALSVRRPRERADRRARAERRQRRRRPVSLAESRGVVRPPARV